MAHIQDALEREFCPPLDSSLVAAIAHDPDQTLASARELCATLAAAAISSSSSSSSSPTAPSPSPSEQDIHEVDRLLDEWAQIESSALDPHNLQLTDEEQDHEHESEHHQQPAHSVDPLSFLRHAFPARTTTLLRATLADAHGDVQSAIDTLMTLELLDNDNEDILPPPTSTPAPAHKGLDYDALARGLADHRRSKNSKKSKKPKQKSKRTHRNALTLNLTDVRQGAAASATPSAPPKDQDEDADADADEQQSHLQVRDNSWLLTSSVLSQLATLLDLQPDRVTSLYHSSSFNLGLAFTRALEAAADQYPTLDSLDAAGDAPPGTARTMADQIALLAHTDPQSAAKAFRATKGRQDATLDLLQLESVVRTAMGGGPITDPLDPLGRLPSAGSAEVVPALTPVSISAATHNATARPAAAASVQSTPGQARYASVVGRRAQPVPTTGAAAALDRGARIGAVIPASAAPISAPALTPGSHDPSYPVQDPLRRNAEYRLVADDYRLRRDEALRKAAGAWRTRTSGAGRGGVAWHYADEARRLDAKARAWSLRAAQALVSDRPDSRASIDLHGLTVHEALTVTREHTNRWYARPDRGPLQIITGVGRHSVNQVAVLRPAVAKMLEKEGWRFDVDHHRGIITVRGLR